MKWFKHDSDANMDGKLQEVLLDYGLEGYGLYWYCLELITSKVDADNVTFKVEHDARIIARNTGCSVQKVQEMMSRFVDLGLFENVDGIITCLKLAKRIDKSMTSNPVMRGIIGNLIKSHDPIMTQSCVSHDPIMTESCKPMQDKIRLDKNRKEKDLFIQFDEFWEIYPKKVDKKPTATKWKSLKITEEVFTKIKKHLSIAYAQTEKQFIPSPKVYLNNEKWTDELINNSGVIRTEPAQQNFTPSSFPTLDD